MNKRYARFSALFLLLLSGICSIAIRAADTTSTTPAPPIAKRIPKVTEINGRKLVDNYFWLREKKNPEVKAYLEAENAYTDVVMKPTEPLQKKLYDEMLSHIKETDVDVPYTDGGYFYYSRTEAGKQYQIRCRKKGSLDAPEEILLDLNEMAKGQHFMPVAAYEVSEDGNLLAYTTDNSGFRQYTLAIKDLRTGKVLADHDEKVGSVAWANDNKTLFYTVEDSAKRQYRLYRHTLGSSRDDVLVYEEKDERFNVETSKTRSKAYILLLSGSHTTSEVRYLPADQPTAEWKVMEPRQQDVEYYPDHNGDSFYIRVNDTGRNFRLVKAPVSDPRRKNCRKSYLKEPTSCSMTRTFSRTTTSSTSARTDCRTYELPTLTAGKRSVLNFRNRRTLRIPTSIASTVPPSSVTPISRSLRRNRSSNTTWEAVLPRCSSARKSPAVTIGAAIR